MIIWLASFPRSGNSFFRITSRTLFGREIYSIYPEKNKPLNAEELEKARQESDVYLVKTHELPSDSSPAIYLFRDGRDSLVSLTWFNLTRTGKPDRDISEKEFTRALKRTIVSKSFGGWSHNCLAWTQRPQQTVNIRFEDLIAQPEPTIANAFETLGLNSQQKANKKAQTFDELHKHNPLLYRKGKVGNWQTQMPEKLHNLFWKKHGDAMKVLGYTREIAG